MPQQTFLTLGWVFMANNNVDNEPLVNHESHGHFLNVSQRYIEWCGHKAVEYSEKYCLILVSQTIFIHKYSWPH